KGLDIQTPATTKVAPGGPTVTLSAITFSGNTVFSQDALTAAAGDFNNQPLDLAGLRELADRVTAVYQQAGYPFTRAFIAPQQLQDQGTLTIDVVEGRYGNVNTSGDAALAAPTQAYLQNLKPGSLIESSSLERTTLLLSDLPGLNIKPVIKP